MTLRLSTFDFRLSTKNQEQAQERGYFVFEKLPEC